MHREQIAISFFSKTTAGAFCAERAGLVYLGKEVNVGAKTRIDCLQVGEDNSLGIRQAACIECLSASSKSFAAMDSKVAMDVKLPFDSKAVIYSNHNAFGKPAVRRIRRWCDFRRNIVLALAILLLVGLRCLGQRQVGHNSSISRSCC